MTDRYAGSSYGGVTQHTGSSGSGGGRRGRVLPGVEGAVHDNLRTFPEGIATKEGVHGWFGVLFAAYLFDCRSKGQRAMPCRRQLLSCQSDFG